MGQQETQLLEFKSSRELSNESADKRAKFISSQIVPAVSAFLNTDGGQLVIGIEEEKNGIAAHLSGGVPASRISAHQLRSSICSRIQPAVAGHVAVYSVLLPKQGDERLNAFVVDVRQGITAYQADDKKYYARRAGQNEAMEDKDIRLRMMAGDKPRLSINLITNAEMTSSGESISSVKWVLLFANVGMKTVRNALVRVRLDYQGIRVSSVLKFLSRQDRLTEFPKGGSVQVTGLRPGEQYEYEVCDFSKGVFYNLPGALSEVSINLDVMVFIDDGPATEFTNYDLMTVLRPIILNEWKLENESSERQG